MNAIATANALCMEASRFKRVSNGASLARIERGELDYTHQRCRISPLNPGDKSLILVLDQSPNTRRVMRASRWYPPFFANGSSFQNLSAAARSGREQGMAEMSEKFRQMGNEVYVEQEAVKESNKVL